jgi:hypothetical protein
MWVFDVYAIYCSIIAAAFLAALLYLKGSTFK